MAEYCENCKDLQDKFDALENKLRAIDQLADGMMERVQRLMRSQLAETGEGNKP